MFLAPRLADAVVGRDNNVKALRYAAALAVIVTHSHALAGDFAGDPLYRLLPQTNLGLLGVQVFFVLSGFLIARSWDARHDVARFVEARVLRIYPALAAAVLFSVVAAWWFSGIAAAAFFGDARTWRYAVAAASGWNATLPLPAAFAHNPLPGANGSLWTLPVELRLYALVAAFGAAGLLGRRWVACAAWCGLVALLAAFAWAGAPLLLAADHVRGLVGCFALGALACATRDVLRLSVPVAVLACVAYALNPGDRLAGIAGLPLIAYAVLVAAFHPALRVHARWLASRTDYSYGAYVFAFPVQQIVVALRPGISPTALLLAALPPILVLAALSWHFIEARALRRKPGSRAGLSPAAP